MTTGVGERSMMVVDPGFATTLQDRGRRGWAHLGVPRAGPVEPALADLANRLVGNPPGTALFETAGGLELELRSDAPLLVAATTSTGPSVLEPGRRIRVGHDPHRTFHYLAVAGGVVAEPVLGSVSHDTLSGLGPDPVSPGGIWRIGTRIGTSVDERTTIPDIAPLRRLPDVVPVHPGPRPERFRDDAVEMLCATVWRVAAGSDRVGVRLDADDGTVLPRRDGPEPASEGLVLGAVQVPHDGRPVVMSVDHPTTGGYPVVAVIPLPGLVGVLQRPAGATVRFVPSR